MDDLKLQPYTREVSPDAKNANRHSKVAGDKARSGNTVLKGEGHVESGQKFLEYYINDTPLSKLLDSFYNTKTSVLDNWIGALGASLDTKADVIKVKQLLGKKVSDEDIRRVYPASWTEEEFTYYLEKYREELDNPEVLLYCCAVCGEYDCGGIAANVDSTETTVTWTFREADKTLRFEFDKHAYNDELNKYFWKVSK